jgi:polar amino acid transport system substrate-binding protein
MSGRFHRTAVLCALALFLALLPAFAVRAAGLQVGADVSGAPFEYFPANSHVPLGFDIDLLAAISQKMNRPITVANHQFDGLIPSVRDGKVDAAMSAMSDTADREKLVDFVDYFVAGGGIMVGKGNPGKIFGIDGLCGYGVSVEGGTSYENDLRQQSKACEAVGLGPIAITTFSTDDEAFAAFVAGKTPAYVADYPVQVYRSHGTSYEIVGRQFDVVPYGIAVSKNNVALRDAFVQALLAVVADGTYDKLLKKWGLSQGALRFASVNAGKLYHLK